MTSLKNIQNFLKESFEALKLKRKNFVEESGIPYTTYERLMKKTPRNIELTTLLKIANYFDTSLDKIINNDATKKDPNISYNNISLDKIGSNIRLSIQQKLKETSLTPYQLGENCDIGETTIPNFLIGKSKMLQVSTLIKVADYFKLSLDEMIGQGHTANHKTQQLSNLSPPKNPVLVKLSHEDIGVVENIRGSISSDQNKVVNSQTSSNTPAKHTKNNKYTPSL